MSTPRRKRHRRGADASAATPRRTGMSPLPWLLAIVAVLYAVLAWLACGRDEWWLLGVIDGQQLFAIDDAYRFYLAKTAWLDPDLYAWNYVLPGPVLADGTLASLTGGNLYLMRTLHVVAACATLGFTWHAGVRLGASRLAMSVSTSLLALMPLFAFVFLSFYGETWLTLALAAALYCFASGRERSAALLFALLPLLRPEGIFFIAPLGLHYLLRRRFDLLALLGGPGFLYALHLLYALDSIAAYGDWRLELARILANVHDSGLRRAAGFLDSFNALWVLPAIAGLFTAPLRRWWPLWSGALLWLLWTVVSIGRGLSYHEARYLLSLLPVLAIGWPFFFVAVARRWPGKNPQAAATALLLALSLFVTLEHFRQIDPVKAAWGNQRWPVPGLPAARDYVGTLSARAIGVRAATADAVANMVAGNPAIDRVLVTSTEVFYHLDPRIQARARVVYVPINEAVAARWLDGRFFGMFPGGSQYAYYRLRAPRPDDRHLALYVGTLEGAGVAPVFRQGNYAIYLVGFEATLKDGSPAPDFAPTAAGTR